MSKQSRLKNILEAISHWLNYEKICRKQNLFNEKYLSYPIGQFLQSRFTKRLQTEYQHPFLNSKKVGSKPKIDFVIKETIDDNDEIIIAIETKWLSDSRTLLKDCIKDILRLALLAEQYKDKVSCYFIVCGKYSDWKSKIENNKKFYYENINRQRVNLLNLGVPGHNNIRPHAPHKKFAKLIESALSELDLKTNMPEAIRITYYGKYPDKPRRDDYVAIGWKIKTYHYGV